jgi:hypothetical protein
MADTIELTVDTRELDAALKALPAKLCGAIMRKALQAAGNVMLEAVVGLTPERTDEETPDGTSLPAGMLKASMTTQLVVPNSEGLSSDDGRRFSSSGLPRVKVGPEKVGKSNPFGRVAYWQNNGWTLTGHATRTNPNARHGKQGWKKGREIRAIPGKHFMEAAFDQSAETAVDMFLATLADGLFGNDEGTNGPEWNSHDVEFD